MREKKVEEAKSVCKDQLQMEAIDVCQLIAFLVSRVFAHARGFGPHA
jgi:hypothetical protein